ncbi:hypothetical protein [Pseudomonas sp. FG-3G]|nr:hypothetical protein [Pseudomonas sp. FG-3G]
MGRYPGLIQAFVDACRLVNPLDSLHHESIRSSPYDADTP